MSRDGRGERELREVHLERDAVPYAEGSCLVSFGDTRVLCSASVEESVPSWREASGSGWVTAEYGMLPRSTHTRRGRERAGPSGRTSEIQRLIGRSLRSVSNLSALGARTVIVDCDVLQADGGTRTASITGACVALALAFDDLVATGRAEVSPLTDLVAAVSVGLIDQGVRLDLNYREDQEAQVDMNVVGTGAGTLVEVQGTAEGAPFSRDDLDEMMTSALAGIRLLTGLQREILEEVSG